MAAPVIPRSFAAERSAAGQGDVACFFATNFGISFLMILRRQQLTLSCVRSIAILFSGHMGMIKPDPAIYAHLKKPQACQATRCVRR